MHESHLTNFPQAAAWAEAKPMSTAYATVLEGRGHKKLSFTNSLQAELGQHNTSGMFLDESNVSGSLKVSWLLAVAI